MGTCRSDGRKNHEHVKAVKRCDFDYADGIYYLNIGSPKVEKPTWLPAPWRVHNQEWITAAALKFIERQKDSPFFLYMPTTLTHVPNPLPSLMDGAPRATPAGLLNEAPRVQPSRADLLERIRKAGMWRRDVGVMWLDDAVGAVLEKLDSLGLSENSAQGAKRRLN